MNNINKVFDSVKFQRERRAQLSKLLNENPEEYFNQLEKIRKKIRIRQKTDTQKQPGDKP